MRQACRAIREDARGGSCREGFYKGEGAAARLGPRGHMLGARRRIDRERPVIGGPAVPFRPRKLPAIKTSAHEVVGGAT